jgi:hypothetical protein
MSFFGVFDAPGEHGIGPGAWRVDAEHSTAALRLHRWLDTPVTVRLPAPSGEIRVDVVTGVPSRRLLRIPLTGGRAGRGQRRGAPIVARLFDTGRFPEATLRLYAAEAAGADEWAGSAVLTVGGCSDRVAIRLRHENPAPRRGHAHLTATARFSLHHFPPVVPVRHVRPGVTLHLGLALSIATLW